MSDDFKRPLMVAHEISDTRNSSKPIEKDIKDERSTDQEPPQVGQRSKLSYQLGMFTLCYFTWVCVHMQREFWAMSKEVILD